METHPKNAMRGVTIDQNSIQVSSSMARCRHSSRNTKKHAHTTLPSPVRGDRRTLAIILQSTYSLPPRTEARVVLNPSPIFDDL